jgi:hypothetical protein
MRYLIALLLSCSTLMAAPPIGYNDPTIGGLVGWWTMNEGTGTNVYDYSGNNYNGLSTNSVQWTNGIVQSCINFTGGNTNIIKCGNIANNPSSLSVLCWVYWQITNNNKYYAVAKLENTATGAGWALGAALKKTFFISQNPGGTVYYEIQSTNIVSAGWHHLAVSFSSPYSYTNAILYLDGVVNSQLLQNGGIPSSISNSVNLRIGSNELAAPGTVDDNPWIGQIDDVRIYNRALSSNEILKLYNGGYGSQK